MKRINQFSVEEEPVMAMIKAGRIQPFLTIRLKVPDGAQIFKIQAERASVISIFQEEDKIFILARDANSKSVVLEIFKGEERVGGLFLQGEQMTAILGKKNLAPEIIIKRLRSIFF